CGRLEEALAAFRDGVALEKSGTLARHGAAGVLRALGRHEEAVAEFEWVVRELEPNYPGKSFVRAADGPNAQYESARFGLAESLLCLGRFAEASAAARRALQLPPLEAKHQTLRRCLEVSEGLAPVAAELPALDGTRLPANPGAALLLAEWL